MSYFNIKQDKEIIATGGFWCKACQSGKPLDDISPDPRYCQVCYSFLKNEATMLPTNKRPKWIPRDAKISQQKAIPVSRQGDGILSTSNHQKIRVDKIQPQDAKTTMRGRRPADLPVDLILELAAKSMGSKRIASELAKQGITANYRTIARLIVKQGVLAL